MNKCKTLECHLVRIGNQSEIPPHKSVRIYNFKKIVLVSVSSWGRMHVFLFASSCCCCLAVRLFVSLLCLRSYTPVRLWRFRNAPLLCCTLTGPTTLPLWNGGSSLAGLLFYVFYVVFCVFPIVLCCFLFVLVVCEKQPTRCFVFFHVVSCCFVSLVLFACSKSVSALEVFPLNLALVSRSTFIVSYVPVQPCVCVCLLCGETC